MVVLGVTAVVVVAAVDTLMAIIRTRRLQGQTMAVVVVVVDTTVEAVVVDTVEAVGEEDTAGVLRTSKVNNELADVSTMHSRSVLSLVHLGCL